MRDTIVNKIVEVARQEPWVTCAWLFGSMARGDEVPGSDIDIRVGVTRAVDGWWRILAKPLEPYLIATEGDRHVRIVVLPGYVIDLGCEEAPPGLIHVTEHRPVRALIEKTPVVDAPTPAPEFVDPIHKLYPVELPSPVEVETWIAETLVNMLSYPAMVARGDEPSRQLYCALYRADLAKLVYRLEKVQWAKGFKHLSTWTDRSHLVACNDALLWLNTLTVLQALAGAVNAHWPGEFVFACFNKYREDLATAGK
mgnify:CR=1 FL=1